MPSANVTVENESSLTNDVTVVSATVLIDALTRQGVMLCGVCVVGGLQVCERWFAETIAVVVSVRERAECQR